MTRTEMDILERWNEKGIEFDWGRFQYLCDLADHWDYNDLVLEGYEPGYEDFEEEDWE